MNTAWFLGGPWNGDQRALPSFRPSISVALWEDVVQSPGWPQPNTATYFVGEYVYAGRVILSGRDQDTDTWRGSLMICDNVTIEEVLGMSRDAIAPPDIWSDPEKKITTLQ